MDRIGDSKSEWKVTWLVSDGTIKLNKQYMEVVLELDVLRYFVFTQYLCRGLIGIAFIFDEEVDLEQIALSFGLEKREIGYYQFCQFHGRNHIIMNH